MSSPPYASDISLFSLPRPGSLGPTNLGLITPEIIIERIKKVESKIKINSYEGYVRQIIAWREFLE